MFLRVVCNCYMSSCEESVSVLKPWRLYIIRKLPPSVFALINSFQFERRGKLTVLYYQSFIHLCFRNLFILPCCLGLVDCLTVYYYLPARRFLNSCRLQLYLLVTWLRPPLWIHAFWLYLCQMPDMLELSRCLYLCLANLWKRLWKVENIVVSIVFALPIVLDIVLDELIVM